MVGVEKIRFRVWESEHNNTIFMEWIFVRAILCRFFCEMVEK